MSILAAQVASDYKATADYQAKGTLKTIGDIYQSYITCVPNISGLIPKEQKVKDQKTMAGTRVLLVGATGKTGSSIANGLLETGAFVSEQLGTSHQGLTNIANVCAVTDPFHTYTTRLYA
jgi:hypothetical protein